MKSVHIQHVVGIQTRHKSTEVTRWPDARDPQSLLPSSSPPSMMSRLSSSEVSWRDPTGGGSNYTNFKVGTFPPFAFSLIAHRVHSRLLPFIHVSLLLLIDDPPTSADFPTPRRHPQELDDVLGPFFPPTLWRRRPRQHPEVQVLRTSHFLPSRPPSDLSVQG